MASTPCLTGHEKKHWWLSNRKIVDKYIKDARNLIATQEESEIASALKLIEAALSISPRFEVALELKARCLLYLRRFKDVANMLQDYIPSIKSSATGSDTDSVGSVSSDNSSSSSQQLNRDRVKLLASDRDSDSRDSLHRYPSIKCFSVSELKKRVLAGIWKNCDKEGQWRYLVLGRALCHLGLMEDALVLLQTGKRLSTAALRRQSNSWSDDSFSVSNFSFSGDVIVSSAPPTPPQTLIESENISHLLAHIKLLLRRRTAALAALDAGLYSEAIRHFSKILEGRREAPQGFLAECYLHRAFAYKSSGRIAESIADCNKTLALDPTCIQALETRALLFESIGCFPDSLHDLEHLKFLYNSILRDRKLPGPAWKRHNVSYKEIPGKLCALTKKIQGLKQKVASRETPNIDCYALVGLRRGCSRSELERAHLLLSLRHKPDKSTTFIERCEFVDDMDLDSVKDRAKLSAMVLYRLIQKGYTSLAAKILEEEAAEKQRKKAAAETLQAAQAAIQVQQTTPQSPKTETKQSTPDKSGSKRVAPTTQKRATSSGTTNPSVYQGVFCRDLAAVGNLLSQVRFNRPIPVKYAALSC